MLEDGDSYGYALSRELDAQGLGTDSAVTYRLLRKLDDDGWVSSQWTTSAVGPRRRSYHLTPKGRRVLHDMAADITGARDAHERFLRAFEPALEQRGRSPSTPAKRLGPPDVAT